MNEIKPWYSFDEQLAQIKRRGLQVDDDEAALDYLRRIGYYRLVGYWYPFRTIDESSTGNEGRVVRTEQFLEGSRFEDAAKLYVFDKRLRLIALDALERIELALRVDVAYLLGERDPCAHENPKCFHGNFTKKTNRNSKDTDYDRWKRRYHRHVERARKEPFVQHHRRKYNKRLPIWVAIELWDFGLLSHLFAGMKYADQQTISRRYLLEDGKVLAKWLRSLNFVRNVSAHHSRLWNINIIDQSSPLTEFPTVSTSKPFMYFLIMARLLSVICPQSTWTDRLIQLLHTFPTPENEALTLGGFGARDNWEEVLRAAAKNREPTRT